jgi:glucokinase
VFKIKEKFIVGVDIGGTWIRVAICSADLNVANIKSKTTHTPQDDEYSISRTVVQLLTELMAYNLINPNQILGIGLATAGPIDLEKGEIFNNANLGFELIPLKKPLEEEFPDIPIYLINDCNAAVLGVHYFEADEEEKDNLVYITMSTGIGGGVICNGRLLLGKEGNAAEIGHGIVEANSDILCNCGAYGCWEVYSSGTGIRSRALKAIKEGKLNTLTLMKVINYNKQKLTAKEIFQAARKGDELSKKIVDDCIFYSKIGIGLVNNFYDCTAIYLGGAMMNDADQILPRIREQFELDPIRFTINHTPRIKVTTLGDDVGIRGALALVKYKSENNPIVF